MIRVLLLARREWLEQSRQPVMLAVIGTLFALVSLILVSALTTLDTLIASPDRLAELGALAGGGDTEVFLERTAGSAIGMANVLIFTQLLGTSSVMAGHTMLHDRQCGTLPFLLLAPVQRGELLLGKVLGAVGWPVVLYFLFGALTALGIGRLPLAEPFSALLPPTPAWWVTFLLGGPLWAIFVAMLCAIASSLSRDVRTAQQVVGFVMFFATFGCATMLAALLPMGAVIQLSVVALALAANAGVIIVGAGVLSRDLGR